MGDTFRQLSGKISFRSFSCARGSGNKIIQSVLSFCSSATSGIKGSSSFFSYATSLLSFGTPLTLSVFTDVPLSLRIKSPSPRSTRLFFFFSIIKIMIFPEVQLQILMYCSGRSAHLPDDLHILDVEV